MFFLYLDTAKLKKVDSIKLEHTNKINCLKALNKKIFIADTSNTLIIYEF